MVFDQYPMVQYIYIYQILQRLHNFGTFGQKRPLEERGGISSQGLISCFTWFGRNDSSETPHFLPELQPSPGFAAPAFTPKVGRSYFQELDDIHKWAQDRSLEHCPKQKGGT